MKEEGWFIASLLILFIATLNMPLKARLMLIETITTLEIIIILRQYNDPMRMTRYPSRLAWSHAILHALVKYAGWAALSMSYSLLHFAYAAGMNMHFLCMFIICFLNFLWMDLGGYIHPSLLIIGTATLVCALGMDLDIPFLRCIFDPYTWMNMKILMTAVLFHGMLFCTMLLIFYRRRLP